MGLYRATRLFGYFVALVWGFVGAYALLSAIISHHHTLVVLLTIGLGLVFAAMLETIFHFVIDLVFAGLIRILYSEGPDSPVNLGDRWSHRS
jgi:hypothetical protein